MKEMKIILAGIDENLKELSLKLAEKQTQIAALEQQIEGLMGKQEKIEVELKDLQNQISALQNMKKAAESADFHLNPPKEKDEITGATIIKKPVKQVAWTRKNGTLIQIDRNQNQVATYVNQKAAARKLGWDQGSMSRFVRLDIETQIRKKGFAFKWIP